MQNNNIDSANNIVEISDEKKMDMEFRFYGIFTFWLIPLYFISLIGGNGAMIFILPLIGFLLEYFNNKFTIILKKIILYTIMFLFGVKIEKKDIKLVRFWWFFAIGYLLGTLLSLASFYGMILIIPILLIRNNRGKFLRFIFSVYFLPKTEYIWTKSKVDRDRIIQKYQKLTESEKEYLIFDKPVLSTHITAAIIILLSPIMISLLLAPVNLIRFYSLDGINLVESGSIVDYGMQYAGLGLISIIPYILLNIPFRGNTVSRIVTTKISTFITKNLATTGLNAIPFFKGEYYLELESDIIDMASSNGFFEIFKKGRLSSIILTPLAIMSLILKYTLENISSGTLNDKNLSAFGFLQKFSELVNSNILFTLVIMILIPIVISIILPLIWNINDAEIKRASWRHMNSDFKTEIATVEDLGTSIDRIFKFIIGISAITNLSSSIALIIGQSDQLIAWTVTLVVLIVSGVMVIPGTLTMAYLYFASGDHVDGVNHLRYNLSQEHKISVGTISRNYDSSRRLSKPRKYSKFNYKTSLPKVMNNSEFTVSDVSSEFDDNINNPESINSDENSEYNDNVNNSD